MEHRVLEEIKSVQNNSWRRQWHPTPVLLPGKSQGWRSLVGCSPWGREESDTTERLHFHFSLSCIGEGNGNPLQCSCLDNPRDGGAWWATVYGVAQNRTRLKPLSSRIIVANIQTIKSVAKGKKEKDSNKEKQVFVKTVKDQASEIQVTMMLRVVSYEVFITEIFFLSPGCVQKEKSPWGYWLT